ncbi:MAG: methyltransferase domain-containing protein [Lentisphaeria bacterium]
MINILTNTYYIFPLPAKAGQIVELDMGCGKGKMALELAERYPDRLILASDIMMGRLGHVERAAARNDLYNILILRATSLALTSFQLPPASIDRIHLLCPDPWPKKRHTGRRVICTDFLCRLSRILKSNGILHLSTDYAPYFDDWEKILATIPFFEPAPEALKDVADIKTDFELHWLKKGIPVRHMAWRYTVKK